MSNINSVNHGRVIGSSTETGWWKDENPLPKTYLLFFFPMDIYASLVTIYEAILKYLGQSMSFMVN